MLWYAIKLWTSSNWLAFGLKFHWKWNENNTVANIFQWTLHDAVDSLSECDKWQSCSVLFKPNLDDDYDDNFIACQQVMVIHIGKMISVARTLFNLFDWGFSAAI